MNLARLKLVTFDVTDTLLQFRNNVGKQYSEIGALHGIKCPKQAIAQNFKTHWYLMKKEHPNFGLVTGIGWEKWWKLLVYRTFKDADLNADDAKLEIISSKLIEMYKSSQCWQQCYGALGLLSYLRNRGITLGVLSNFDERLPVLLENTKLRHYFRFVITSYEAGFEKPDERIFNEALCQAKIPNLKPEQCLHIGDTAALDYLGARKAGWHSALIHEDAQFITKKYSDIDPDHIYRTLYDLHKYFIDSESKKESIKIEKS